MIDVVREIFRTHQRIGAVHRIHDELPPGLERLPAHLEKRDGFIDGQVIELLLGNDAVEVGVLMTRQIRKHLSHLTGQPAATRMLDLGGVRVDADHVPISALDQQIDQGIPARS